MQFENLLGKTARTVMEKLLVSLSTEYTSALVSSLNIEENMQKYATHGGAGSKVIPVQYSIPVVQLVTEPVIMVLTH